MSDEAKPRYTIEHACGYFWVVDNDPPPGASRYVRNTTHEDEAQAIAEWLNDGHGRQCIKEPTVTPPA